MQNKKKTQAIFWCKEFTRKFKQGFPHSLMLLIYNNTCLVSELFLLQDFQLYIYIFFFFRSQHPRKDMALSENSPTHTHESNSSVNCQKMFKIKHKIGSGSTSTVFLGETETGSPVCIKAISTTHLSKREKNYVFQEPKLLHQLSPCPHIINLLHAQFEANLLVLVLEYASGGDLASALSANSKPFPMSIVHKWASQIASALEFIHAFNVLHRDIKPRNILVTKEFNLKLADFGSSKAVTHQTNWMTDSIVGTPLNLAPEILKGQPYGFGADLWAFGCVLYQIVSGGAHPFACKSHREVICNILHANFAPLHNPSTDEPRIHKLIYKLLEPIASNRPSPPRVLRYLSIQSNRGSQVSPFDVCETERVRLQNAMGVNRFSYMYWRGRNDHDIRRRMSHSGDKLIKRISRFSKFFLKKK